jgi:hypothetical protein
MAQTKNVGDDYGRASALRLQNFLGSHTLSLNFSDVQRLEAVLPRGNLKDMSEISALPVMLSSNSGLILRALHK